MEMSMSDPNFLLISVDSLRADFCSFLNDSEGTMDFLDDFAAESTVFEQAIGRVAKRSRLCRWYSQLRGHS